MSEPAESVVHVSVGWSDEDDEPIVDLCEPGDTDDEPYRQEGDVPAHLWVELERHAAAWRAARDAIVALIDVTDGGTRREPCGAYRGDFNQDEPYWTVVLSASGSADEWPVTDAVIGYHYDSRDAADAALEALPDEFWLAGGGPVPVRVTKDRLHLVKHDGWASWDPCASCGHEHSDHLDTEPW